MALPSSNDVSFSSTWRRAALVPLAVLVLAGIAGCASNDDSASKAAMDADTETAAPTVEAEGTGGGDGAVAAYDDAGGSSAPDVVPASTGPRVIRTASMRVRVKGDVVVALERATDIATVAGGFVASSSTTSPRAGRSSGELAVRVPVARFDEVRRQLARLGKVQSTESGSQDVGGQLVDLAARLRSLRAEEGALVVILGEARDIGQILQVRDRLTGVRTQVEQLAGQQAALEDQVAYATLRVSLYEAGAPAEAPSETDEAGLVASFRSSIDALETVVGGILIVLGAALPFALLALVGWLVYRRVRRPAAV